PSCHTLPEEIGSVLMSRSSDSGLGVSMSYPSNTPMIRRREAVATDTRGSFFDKSSLEARLFERRTRRPPLNLLQPEEPYKKFLEEELESKDFHE
ncbi:hypothetical protein H0H93_015451, partial [Arthromyces matolae]